MNKKGESGISTLIIFIAMLLVAAVAAGVLIQTTGSLQNKALTTGQQSKAQISTHLEIINAVGTDGSDGDIEGITMIMKLSPGSESIEFEELIMTVDTVTNFDTLSYESNYTNLDAAEYVVKYLENGTNHRDGYLVRGDVAQIELLLPNNLNEDEAVRMDIIPKVGIPTSLEINMPDIMTDLRIHLYP